MSALFCCTQHSTAWHSTSSSTGISMTLQTSCCEGSLKAVMSALLCCTQHSIAQHGTTTAHASALASAREHCTMSCLPCFAAHSTAHSTAQHGTRQDSPQGEQRRKYAALGLMCGCNRAAAVGRLTALSYHQVCLLNISVRRTAAIPNAALFARHPAGPKAHHTRDSGSMLCCRLTPTLCQHAFTKAFQNRLQSS
jgi:hypothetical protein